MTDYTPAEVLSALGEGIQDIYWDELGWSLKENPARNGGIILRGEPVEVTVVDDCSGSEGDYNIGTYVVIQVGTQYFRKTGHYMSHYGDDWDGPFLEVIPTEKTVTVFEEI